MKQKLIRLSRRYVWELHKYLTQGKRASLRPARGLGLQAMKFGLGTTDVARIHREALGEVKAVIGGAGIQKRAGDFLTQATTPIEKAALKLSAHANNLNESLDRRTVDLAAANRSLKLGIAQRKTAEKALLASSGRCKKLLEESHHLQNHLRDLARRIMTMQENKRKEISHGLQDEIAQTLLGINVHLLTLKKAATIDARGFDKEIASTQRLVGESIKSINRFAQDLNLRQQP